MTDGYGPPEDLFPYTTYVLGGITYVPHYTEVGMYVGPGYPQKTNRMYTAGELQRAGARPVTEALWKRPRA